MALTGINTPVTLWNSTSNVTEFSGSLDVVAGQLIHVHIWAWTGSGGQTPSTQWTVTFDGVPMTLRHEIVGTSVAMGGAGYWIIAPTTKTGAVIQLTMGAAGRGSIAHAWRIDGFDTTTPIAGHSGNSSFGGDINTMSMPNGFTPSQAGNGVCTSIMVRRGGEAAALSNSGSDGFATEQTGTTTTSDFTSGRNWHDNPPLSPITSPWTWTNPARAAALRFEINVAPASGPTSNLDLDTTLEVTSSGSATSLADSHLDTTLDISSSGAVVSTMQAQASPLIDIGSSGAAKSEAQAQVTATLDLTSTGEMAVPPLGSLLQASLQIDLSSTGSAQTGLRAAATPMIDLSSTGSAQAEIRAAATSLIDLSSTGSAQAEIRATASPLIDISNTGILSVGSIAVLSADPVISLTSSGAVAAEARAAASPLIDLNSAATAKIAARAQSTQTLDISSTGSAQVAVQAQASPTISVGSSGAVGVSNGVTLNAALDVTTSGTTTARVAANTTPSIDVSSTGEARVAVSVSATITLPIDSSGTVIDPNNIPDVERRIAQASTCAAWLSVAPPKWLRVVNPKT